MPRTIFFALVLAIGMASFSDAGIIAQLDTPSQTGAPGDTLVFNVTLTNTSATDQIWLNGIGSTAASPFLSIDTDPFDVNAPLFLDPLESSGLFELMTSRSRLVRRTDLTSATSFPSRAGPTVVREAPSTIWWT